MNKGSPIGFFDSGYGGLTVLKEVQKVLPQSDYLYLGDNQRAPYGTQSSETVYKYTWEGVQMLFSKGCDLVVLACNTASAKALRRIQKNDLITYPGKRVLGVIRPSAEIVGDFSKTNQIIVLGTEGTIAANTYVDEFAFFSPQIKVHQYACPTWVPLIESRQHNSAAGKKQIQKDVETFTKAFKDADIILLGCTHYPILQQIIEENVSDEIQVISQGEIVALSLKLYLERHMWMQEKLAQNGTSLYLTTGNPKEFEGFASTILGIDVDVKRIRL